MKSVPSYDGFDHLRCCENGAVVGGVSSVAGHEGVDTGSAAGFCLGEVGGIAVACQDHVACMVGDDGVGVGGGVVQELLHFFHCVFSWRCLLSREQSKSGEHRYVEGTGVIKESADDFLNKLFVLGAEGG